VRRVHRDSAKPLKPESKPVKHEQFVAQLDGICKRWNGKADANGYQKRWDRANAANDLTTLAELIDWRSAESERWYQQVDKVEAPQADRALFERYMRQNLTIDGSFTKLARALRASDEFEMKRLVDVIADAREQRTKTATSLGLVECGS
jgi:hypothetical protein